MVYVVNPLLQQVMNCALIIHFARTYFTRAERVEALD